MNSGSQFQAGSRSIGEHQRYFLEQRLGQGGMGTVYIATDTLLGRQVAVKILKDSLSQTEGILKRFEREVNLCAALQSENIVQVTDYGITPEGYPFYVMEYLIGQTLGQLMQQLKVVSPERTVKIISQVCNGLSMAHSGVTLRRQHSAERVQVVHRDLKPENLFLVTTTLGELVKILDFGIAKLRHQQTEMTDLHTTNFIGTYRYASPEQLELSQTLDGRSDIYSLGIILYEMLSGTDPFGMQVAQPANGTGMSWIKAHLTCSPIPLRSQPHGKHLPPALDAVVLRCLAKHPEDRWDSVVSLSVALQAAIAGTHSEPQLHSLAVAAPADRSTGQPPGVSSSIPSPISSPIPEPFPIEKVTALEKLLTQEIGPIAAVILPQVLNQATTWPELIDLLSRRMPEEARRRFQDQIRAAEQSTASASKSGNSLGQGTGGSSAATGQRVSASQPVARTVVDPQSPEPRESLDMFPTTQHPTADQLIRIERHLTHAIGPIAKLVITQTLNLHPEIDFVELVQVLAQRIPNPALAAEFLQMLS